MKENVLEVLMYLFQNYIDDDTAIDPDRESMTHALLEAGFPSQQVKQALEWLEGLAVRQKVPVTPANEERSFRIFAPQEIAKLDLECRGFLLSLEQEGILNCKTRELVIDRVMALGTDDIDLTQLKWIILMVLFNQPGQEQAYACVEDMLFEDVGNYLH